MKNIMIKLNSKVNNAEFLKNIGFISEEIIEYTILENCIQIVLSDKADEELIKEKVMKYINNFVTSEDDKQIYLLEDSSREYYSNPYEKSECVCYFGHGNVAFSNKAEFLFRFFDTRFEKIALQYNAQRKLYPTLLPLEAYQKTGYLKRSPQYAMFCCNTFEDIDKLEDLQHDIDNGNLISKLKNPKFALSPSACFHTYLEYEDMTLDSNSVFTFCQNVFRNEGRFNFSELGRLMDYHVREIVMIGSQAFILDLRKQILNSVIKLLQEWKLCASVSVASDPFVMPKIQKFKKIQKSEEVKYEVKLNCSSTHKISVASFNLHGTAFTHSFNIKIADDDNGVTGCIGFGIERWVLAFLCQYSENPDNWPIEIRNAFYKEVKGYE